MFAGHFGVAAGAKSPAPSAPLWALMLATQLLDVIFVPLYLAGIETLEPVDPANANAYGGSLIHAIYTHSLVGALLIALVAGLLARGAWGRQSGLVIAAVVFSHWILDLIVHRPDLPILPGNAGDLPLLGFGLWTMPTVSAVLEGILVVVGAVLYYRAAMRLPAPSIRAGQGYRTRALVTSLVVALLLALSLITSVLGFA